MAYLEGGKEQRTAAARALAGDPPADAFDEFVRALRDRAHAVRRHAAEALGRLGDARAVDALVDALEDDEEHPTCREAAAEALGRIGAEGAVPPLACQLRGPSPALAQACAGALGCIATASAKEALAAALGHAARRDQAAQALCEIGYVPTEQVERIRYLIAQKDDAVVKEGRPALELLIDELDRHAHTAPWAALMLEHILVSLQERLPMEDLRLLAAQQDRRYTWSHYDAWIEGDREESRHIDCAAIRRLANEEIDRREKAGHNGG